MTSCRRSARSTMELSCSPTRPTRTCARSASSCSATAPVRPRTSSNSSALHSAPAALEGLFGGEGKIELGWVVENEKLPKGAVRLLLNLALLAGDALVRGGR